MAGDNEWLEALEHTNRIALERASQTSFQLAAWLLIGNGAGLYFILTTAFEATLPSGASLEQAYLVFLGGLVSGFLSMGVGVLNASFTAVGITGALGDYRRVDGLNGELDKLSNEAEAERSEIEERIQETQNRIARTLKRQIIQATLFGSTSWLLSTLSAGALVYGLSLPLLTGLLK